MTVPVVVARVVGVRKEGQGIGWVDLEGENIALGAAVGQFAMIVRPGEEPGSCGRPYAYFRMLSAHRARFLVRERADAKASLLSAPVGTPVPVRGPLGRPFALAPAPIWAVAGGVGAAAFGGLLTPEHVGAGLKLVLGLRDGSEAGIARALKHASGQPLNNLHVSSEDGSVGSTGSVLHLLAQLGQAHDGPEPALVLACGPTGMLEAVARWAAARKLACEVSVAVPLPCGVGTCGRCVHLDRHHKPLLACVDGPTYPAARLYPGFEAP
jgi:dihydroorotate dehydrogenase electron transfer subunit